MTTVIRRVLPGRKGEGPADAGWTLVEILVVLSIIFIIMAMAFASRGNAMQMSREAALRANLQLMRDAIDQYYADTGEYPDALQDLVREGYMRFVPEDPFTNSATTWQTEPPPVKPFQGGRPRDGIYQVRSGAQATGLDGTRVSQW